MPPAPITSDSTPTCTEGFCDGGFVCDSGFTQCPGNKCEDLNSDTQNCGGCTYACPAPQNSIPLCIGGDCAIQCVPRSGADIQQCDHPNFGPSCPDLLSDSGNCGSCNNSCGEAQSCCGGGCTNTSTDPNNCGSCGYACSGDEMCANGICYCPGSLSLCSGQCADTATDSNNCGSCGAVCGVGQYCEDGTCACPPGESFCGGRCINTSTDFYNCGGCGSKCENGADICVQGGCQSRWRCLLQLFFVQ